MHVTTYLCVKSAWSSTSLADFSLPTNPPISNFNLSLSVSSSTLEQTCHITRYISTNTSSQSSHDRYVILPFFDREELVKAVNHSENAIFSTTASPHQSIFALHHDVSPLQFLIPRLISFQSPITNLQLDPPNTKPMYQIFPSF